SAAITGRSRPSTALCRNRDSACVSGKGTMGLAEGGDNEGVHIRTVLSVPAVTRRPDPKSTDVAPPRWPMTEESGRCQIRSDLSSDPLTSARPFGLNATDVTLLLCPFSGGTSWGVNSGSLVFQSCTD